MNFVYQSLPYRVVFGQGLAIESLESEIRKLGCSKVLFLTTPQQIDVGEALKAAVSPELVGGIYTKATMHTPEPITLEALDYANNIHADCVVAVGGGSTIGLGKALALYSDGRIKQISVPATYAGSECTPILGETKNGEKKTQRTLKVLPSTIIYDVNLSIGLPISMTATSGMNAIAHAVEALYAPEANPIMTALALQGVASLAGALPGLQRSPQDIKARSEALFGAMICGMCLGSVGMGLHHKLCHTLGGSFNMPHAETHTVILPHAVRYNSTFIEKEMSQLAQALGADDAATGLYDLAKSLNAPTSLKELGFAEADLKKAADIASKTPYPNPAPLEKEKLLVLLRNAYDGRRP